MYTRQFMNIDEGSLKNPVAIVGLPGIANVGRLAVEYLVSVFDADVVLQFFCDDFPARVFIRDGLSIFPKSSLHMYRSAPDELHDLLLLTADFQPSNPKGVLDYADFVVQEFVRLGVKEIYSLAAYEQEYQNFFEGYPRNPRVYVSASEKEVLNKLLEIEATIATPSGIINGANGVIPAWASTLYNMKSASLLGETMGVIRMDYRAARQVLSTLCHYLNITVDFQPLEDEIERVNEFIEWAKDEIAQGSMENREDRPSDRYIG